MGHRRYVPMDHPFWRNKRTFDGKQELECAPEVPSGDEILRQFEGVFRDENAGKTPKPPESTKKKKEKEKKTKRKRKRNDKKKEELAAVEILWKKKSIFFRLPYWKDNLLRHNLDVMHIKKKCDGQHTWHNTRH